MASISDAPISLDQVGRVKAEVDSLRSRCRQFQENQAVLESKLRKVSESYEREKRLRVRLNQERDVLHDKLVNLTKYLAEEEGRFQCYLKLRERYSNIFRTIASTVADIQSKNEEVICAEDNHPEDFVSFLQPFEDLQFLDLSLRKATRKLDEHEESCSEQASASDLSDYGYSSGASELPSGEIRKSYKPLTILGKVPVQKDVPIKLLMGPEYVQKSFSASSNAARKTTHNRNRYNFVNIARAFGICYESMTEDQRLAFRNAICQRYSREYKRRKRMEESK